MFICSFKLNKTRVLSGIAALCLSLTLVFLMLPDTATNSGASGEMQGEKEMVEYLASIGHTVAPNALLVEEIMIPAEFDEKYTTYNELQKEGGFDLSAYAGESAKKYTFKLLSYEDAKEDVVVNLIVLDGEIIGGDVSSTTLGGFTKALKVSV